MRDRQTSEIEDALVVAIGEVDGATEARALSLPASEILAQHRPTNLSIYARVVDSPLEDPGVGPEPVWTQRWNIEILIVAPQRTRADEALRTAQRISDDLRSRLANVVLLSGDGKFEPSPLQIGRVAWTPSDGKVLVGTIPCTCVTTFVGDRPVASTSGSGFPTSPNTGDQHYLTGEARPYRWDGTRWHTESEPTLHFEQAVYGEDDAFDFGPTDHCRVVTPLIVRRLWIAQTEGANSEFKINFKKNGSTQEAITVAASTVRKEVQLASAVTFAAGDWITITASDGGATKPANLNVLVFAQEIGS